MAESIFIVDSGEARIDAATARRQFSLSLAVGLAVLAAAALVELQPSRSVADSAEGHNVHAIPAVVAFAATSPRQN
jgi:hypothetical protein